ncbi:hypothetical protein O181_092467 [Austropuccinia psidii MF-1]|uniref:Uncharacterized protein n=1 Tax=Austropuccinia psidii MF-1 TaxID=1389203 RepID=A0A9Q3IZJ2_9BASI|nr:hypothetical protein [Austropuccinia psidii MF-1]
MPKLSTPFSQIRSPFNPKEEIKNPFFSDSSHQDNNQVLIKEAPQLKEWPEFTGEGEYDHMSFINTIEMLQEDSAIKDELNSFFEPDKDKPLTWFLKQAERLNALYPEMSQKMVHMKILKKIGGELKHSLRSRCIEPCSTQE